MTVVGTLFLRAVQRDWCAVDVNDQYVAVVCFVDVEGMLQRYLVERVDKRRPDTLGVRLFEMVGRFPFKCLIAFFRSDFAEVGKEAGERGRVWDCTPSGSQWLNPDKPDAPKTE